MPAISRRALLPLPTSTQMEGRILMSSFRRRFGPAIVLSAVVLLFVFFVLSVIYLVRFLYHYLNERRLRRVSTDTNEPLTLELARPVASQGLPRRILDSFPIFSYSYIRNLKRRKCGLTCAICLSEFTNSDTVRLLTACWHAFHPECIDLWLTTHITCPICRCDLRHAHRSSSNQEHRILIDEEEEEDGGHQSVPDRNLSVGATEYDHDVNDGGAGGDDDDEYTLRLPEIPEGYRWRGRGGINCSSDVLCGLDVERKEGADRRWHSIS